MAPRKPKNAEAPEFDVDGQREQFLNTNDWPLFRPNALFRVKQVEDDQFVMVDRDGDARFVSGEHLSANYEPVKGPHKGEF